jgi:small subunit ribosomal protein S21
MKSKGAGIIVEIRDGNLEKGLKRFKKKIKMTNLMLEIFDREAFVKPSVLKREKKRKAIARNKFKVKQFKEDENIR